MRHRLPFLVLSGLLFGAGLRSAALQASIEVTIARPTPDTLSDTTLYIAATVSSTYQLQGVVATVADRQVTLVYGPNAYCDQFCHPGWAGTLSLDGLPRGPLTITVVATDVLAGTGQSVGTFVYDQPARQQIVQPLAESVARPDLRLLVTCTDDDPVGCTSVTVSRNGEVLASGTTGVDATISLAVFEGQAVTLRFVSTDSTGRPIAEERRVYVESSPSLGEVASVGGPILDVQPDRILYGQGERVVIRTLSSGLETPIDVTSNGPGYAFLTLRGALISTPDLRLFEWRDSSLVDHGSSVTGLAVKGGYAIWSVGTSLYRYDLLLGAETLVSSAGVVNTDNSVAANGDVVYVARVDSSTPYWGYDYHLFRWHAGTSTELTAVEGSWDTLPASDGTNVVFSRNVVCCGPTSILLHDGLQEVILDPDHVVPLNPYVGDFYYAVNGWVAFTRQAVDGTQQVWVRSPSGVLTQRSFFGSSSLIGALSENGSATFRSGNRTYLSLPGLAPRDVASALGRTLWLAGTAYVTLGRSLFRIEGSGVTGPLRFYTATPCRISDTRNLDGPFGGPALAGMSRRVFDVTGSCGIPASAKSVSANVTVTSPEAAGHLRLSPAAGLAPSSSTINFAPGQTRANNAILTLDGAGQIAVQNGGAGSVQVILDVNGWFE